MRLPFNLDNFSFHPDAKPAPPSTRPSLGKTFSGRSSLGNKSQQVSTVTTTKPVMEESCPKNKIEPIVHKEIYPGMPTVLDFMETPSFDNNVTILAHGGIVDLYIYVPSSNKYELIIAEMEIYIRRFETETGIKFVLQLQKEKGKYLMSQLIDSEMQWSFKDLPEFPTISWLFPEITEFLAVVFLDAKKGKLIITTISDVLIEKDIYEKKIEKLDRKDKELAQTYRLSMAMGNLALDDENDDEDDEETHRDEEEEEVSFDEYDCIDFKYNAETKNAKYCNQKELGKKFKLLADCYKHDRTFAVKDKKLHIFKKDEQSEAMPTVAVWDIQNSSHKGFEPKKVMLFNQDSQMLLVHPYVDDNDPNCGKIVQWDLETEKVVCEFQPSKSVNIFVDHIGPVEKYDSEKASQRLFIASNHNAIYTMDTRTGLSTCEISKLQHIAKTPNFICFATTADGKMVSGAQDGTLRFYDKAPGMPSNNKEIVFHTKQAKCRLPGFGSEIIGVDVSADGKYLVATCKTYLLVMRTENADQKSIFDTKTNAHKKPHLRRLALNEADTKWVGGVAKINFLPARFNTGCDGEVWIVTSTGNFLITWNFRKLIHDNVEAYQAKIMDDIIVDETFAARSSKSSGMRAPVLALLPDSVCLVRRTVTQQPRYRRKSANGTVRTKE